MAKYKVVDRFKGGKVYVRQGSFFVTVILEKATQKQLQELFSQGHPAVMKTEPKPPKKVDTDK